MTTISYTCALNGIHESKTYTASTADFSKRLAKFEESWEIVSEPNCILYFDVDVKTNEIDNEIADAIEQEATDYTCSFLKEKFGQDFEPTVAISHGQANDKKKYSVRLYFPQVKTSKKSNQWMVKQLNKKVVQDKNRYGHIFSLIGETDKFFDEKPYANGKQKLRCIGTSKPGEKRPLILKKGKIESTIVSETSNTIVEYFDSEPKQVCNISPVTNTMPSSTIINQIRDVVLKLIEIDDKDVFDWNDRDTWLKTGFVIFNETNGSGDGCNLFLELSSNWRGPNGEVNDTQYVTRTYYSSKTNEQKKVKISWLKKLLASVVKPEHNIDWTNLTDATFASTFSDLFFKDKLVFTGKEKNLEGYHYNGVFWKKLGLNNAEISKGYFNKLYDHYKSALDSCSWLEEKDYNKYLTKIQYIGSSIGRNHIIDVLQKEHYQSDIVWNNHPNLFAFDDCIYDLDTQTQIEPKPEFYINITTGYSIGNLDLISKKTKDEIKTTIQGLFDDEATYKYVMKVMASFLKQGNIEEKCYFWLGKGRNGKGTLSTLLSSSFGNYFGNLNLGYYTDYSKRDDAPNPNLVNLRYARIINTSEIGEDAIDPDKPVQFRTDKFKSITGNDDVEARNLFKNDIVKYKAGKTIIQTNMMPTFPNIDNPNNYSLRERIVIIPFPFVFVDKSQLDKSKPFLKEKNNGLKEKLNHIDFRNAFIAILLETYSEYLKDGLIEPPLVKQEKMKFFDESNKLKEWFYNNIVKSEMNDKTMYIDELLVSYQNVVPKITKAKFIKNIEQIVGKQSSSNDRTGLKTSRGVYSLVGYEWKPESNEIDDDTDEETSD